MATRRCCASPARCGPGLISGAGEDFVYLIMPIRLSS